MGWQRQIKNNFKILVCSNYMVKMDDDYGVTIIYLEDIPHLRKNLGNFSGHCKNTREKLNNFLDTLFLPYVLEDDFKWVVRNWDADKAPRLGR